MSSETGSQGTEDCNGKESSGNSSVKRKRHQISVLEYFTKRRKEAAEKEDSKNTKMADEDISKKRECLAAAAERRFKWSPVTESDSFPTTESQNSTKDSPVLDNKSIHGSSQSPKIDTFPDFSSNASQEDPVLSKFNQLSSCFEVTPSLVPQPDHTILFRTHLPASAPPKPHPDHYHDIWDKDHVRMPCSKENLYPSENKKILRRWDLIQRKLLTPFLQSKDFQESLLEYNAHYKDKWDFEGWHNYCNLYLSDDKRKELFEKTLPEIARLALRLPDICTKPPPLLKRQNNSSVTLSQLQVSCLLANAFFCTFPRRNSQRNSEYSTFPDINFNRLFRGTKDVVNEVKANKMNAILHYFKRVIKDPPTGAITFKRQMLAEVDKPKWESSPSTFLDMVVQSEGTIEDDGRGFLQVDFANRLIGGGVTGEGCVQEEIRFLICPELIVARLFTERLDPNECLIITGAERYSQYSGYAQTFKWTGDYVDFTPYDRWRRRYSEIVAIDAQVFHFYSDQFKPNRLKRELNKAYCGFYRPGIYANNMPALATGNWGCGAFGGDARLKALIQLMAAAHASRNMVYFTFGDKNLQRDLEEIHGFLCTNNISVGQLWSLLQRYEREIKDKPTHIRLYPYLRQAHEDNNSPDTTEQPGQTESSTIDDVNLEPEDMDIVPGEVPSDHSPDYKNETP